MNNARDLHEYRYKLGEIGPSLLSGHVDLPFSLCFFETVLGGEHSGQVSENFIGNFNFWGITLTKYFLGENFYDDVRSTRLSSFYGWAIQWNVLM